MRVMQLSYGQDREGVRPPKVGHPSLAEAGTGRLTPRGKAAAAAFLNRFPKGLWVMALAARQTRKLAGRYLDRFGSDELETLCLTALVKAVRRWRPRHGALTTATVQAIRSELREHFRPARMPVVCWRCPRCRTPTAGRRAGTPTATVSCCWSRTGPRPRSPPSGRGSTWRRLSPWPAGTSG